MKTREFIDQWLRNHLRPDAQSVTSEEQAHFEQILVDVCEAYKQELVHTPDNDEGITAEELAHQLYGARIEKQIDIDKAQDALYGLANDLGCDLLDIDKAKEYIRKAMEG